MTLRLDPRGTPQPLTPLDGYYTESSAMFSPDGRWVAYDSDQSGSRQVHVRPLKGGGESFRVPPWRYDTCARGPTRGKRPVVWVLSKNGM